MIRQEITSIFCNELGDFEGLRGLDKILGIWPRQVAGLRLEAIYRTF